jgi:hypothetical protein
MPGPLRMPSGPDPALLAEWQRVQHHASGLFAALDRLDERGGVALVAARQGWSADAMDRAIGTLLATREGLTSAIGRLESRRRHYPRRRRIG